MQCYSCKRSKRKSKLNLKNPNEESLQFRLRRLMRQWFSKSHSKSKNEDDKRDEHFIKFRLTEHRTSVVSSAILTNGHLVTGSLSGQIVYHQLNHDSTSYLTGHKDLGRDVGAVRSLLALSNSEFACGFSKGSIIVWHSKWTDGIKWRLDEAHKDPVWSMTLLTKRYMASGSYGEIKIWDLEKTKIGLTHTIKDCPYIALCLTALSNEDLASGYNDGSIIVWHLSMNILFTSHKVKQKLIVSICFKYLFPLHSSSISILCLTKKTIIEG
jgi:hypothetical protein